MMCYPPMLPPMFGEGTTSTANKKEEKKDG